jgi:branched-chain amino acid transport system permease protein
MTAPPAGRSADRGTLLRRALGALAAVVVIVVAIVIPSYLNAYTLYILTEIVIFAIACLGLTVVIGWSGQVALAQAGFFGLGAYGTAYLVSQGISWFVAVLLAALIAAVIGALIGIPTTRLRGFYFAIATLAFGELMTQIFNEWTSVTGGPAGFPVDLLSLGSISPTTSLWYVSAIILGLAIVLLWHFSRTRWGRCLRAVRDMEIATGSLGLSAMKYKVEAFAVSAVLGSIAGSLFGQALTFITPSSFTSTLVIEFLIVVLVGGVDKVAGALVGAAFLVLVQEQLQSVGAYQRLVFGAALVVMVRFLPQGIMPLVYTAARRVLRLGPRRPKVNAEPDQDTPAVSAVTT